MGDDTSGWSDQDYAAWWDSWQESDSSAAGYGEVDTTNWSTKMQDSSSGGGSWTDFLQGAAKGALQNRWDTEKAGRQSFNGSAPGAGAPAGVPAQPGYSNVAGRAVPRWVMGVGVALGLGGAVWAVAHAMRS